MAQPPALRVVASVGYRTDIPEIAGHTALPLEHHIRGAEFLRKFTDRNEPSSPTTRLN